MYTRRYLSISGSLTPLNFLAPLARVRFSPRLNRRSKLTHLGYLIKDMSGLVTYGGSDEEDVVESLNDGEPASEVRLRLSSPRYMAMADCIDLRLQLRLSMLLM